MPSFEYTGADPIDHFYLGRVSPGDVVELDEFDGPPPAPWKPSKRKPKQTEHGSDTPDISEEV